MSDVNYQFLSGIEHIQKRPGMYIGDLNDPRTLVKELVDNALDEFLNGFSKRIEIDYDYEEGWYRVRDNGRGLPLHRIEDHDNEIATKLLFMHLYSGGKFDNVGYKYSAGLHGVGLSVVNALSKLMRVRVNNRTENNLYVFETEKGVPTKEEFVPYDEVDAPWWSSEVTCYPDPDHFRVLKTTIDTLSIKLALRMHTDGNIIVNNRKVDEFDFKDELSNNLMNDTVFTTIVNDGSVRFEIQYGWSSESFNEKLRGAVNLTTCHQGWHVNMARSLIGEAIELFAPELVEVTISRQEAVCGIRVFANLLANSPSFTSQTKERLSWISDPHQLPKKVVDAVRKTLLKDEVTTRSVLRRIIEYKKQLRRLSDQEFVNSVIRTGTDKRTKHGVAGVYECTKSGDGTELFIVEGKSAASNMLKTRNRLNQAILPLRGKPLNVVSAENIAAILGNTEMVALVNAIGAGLYPDVRIEEMRYDKIIVAPDADADGAQISALIIGAMTYLVPAVIESGRVYEVLPPLYKQGDKYIWDDSDLDPNKPHKRFKGLGSMDPDQLYAGVLNPETRRLRKIILDSRDKVLDIMSSSSEKRRIMIQNGIMIEEIDQI